MSEPSDNDEAYSPDPRLREAYEEATRLDRSFLNSVCPEYVELEGGMARYSDETLLGQGALKEVYRTYDRQTRRWVAKARLREDRGIEYYDDFVKEARLISSLNHPNIIKVYDIGIDDGRPFFTMDLKGGRSLEQVLGEKALTSRQLLDVFVKICDAVAYAHSQSVIHLDLKPENIQCDAYGEVLVCDWGIGRRLDQKSEGADDSHEERAFLKGPAGMDPVRGSPGYMAPEQTIPDSPKDPRTDIYSLGCILHAILTGCPPFQGSGRQILEDTRLSKVASLRRRYPKRRIPKSLEAIVLKSLHRDPVMRYDSVESLRNDLANYLSGFATLAEQAGFIRETRLFLRRNWLPTSIVLAAVILGSVGSVLFIQQVQKQEKAIIEERERAERLLSTVDELYSDYSQLEEHTAASNEELARRLAEAARRLKDYGIFDQPVETIEQAADLTKIAISLDPDSPEALWQLFSQHCLRLNYKAALALPPDVQPYRGAGIAYDRFAKALPEFNFSKEHLPSSQDLVKLIETAGKTEPDQAAHLERVLAYQFAVNPSMERPHEVVAAYLEYINPESAETITLNFERETSTLRLNAGNRIRLRPQSPGSSGRSILRFMGLRHLVIASDNGFDIGQIENLAIETLDLRDCGEIALDTIVHLPRLRTILLRPGQMSPEAVRKYVQSDIDYEIVETTRGRFP